METAIVDWKMRCSRRSEDAPAGLEDVLLDARVPGDVTDDLIRQGLAEDISYADNCLRYRWIPRCEWTYTTMLCLTEQQLKSDLLYLEFGGIDTFAEIRLNGRLLRESANMFLPCRADLQNEGRVGENLLEVKILPTEEVMQSYENERYAGAFTNRRLLARKAQCHFGWDWAPDYPGCGLWLPVRLICKSFRSLESVRVRTRTSGEITFFPEVNYSPRRQEFSAFSGDRLRIVVRQDGEGAEQEAIGEYPVQGSCNLCNLTLKNPRLWQPNGAGEAALYRYTVELVSPQGEVLDRLQGRFGVREVRVLEAPIGSDRLDFRFFVNGRETFLKGSNWVPASFLTGAIPEERYRKLLSLARDAGFNVLRVWGGGIYEKELFYDLCDEYGILVYQDFMFACGDIPDERDDFCRLVAEEAEYQVRRLNHHPCMLVWNGGNETKQSFAYSAHPEWGEYLTDYLLAGICQRHTDVPYVRSCPWSYTDWGNDLNSGDCHKCAVFESAIEGRLEDYRRYIVKEKPLTTECAMLGPCRVRNLKKFIPPEKLWPISDIWELHFVDNPYEPKLPRSFARLEMMVAEALFGQPRGLNDFVKKAMLAHADVLTAELDFARADRKLCGGILNWMYNDIWRNGTWAVVDYDFGCKPAYYAMKRAFSTVRAGIVLREGYAAFAVNDGDTPIEGTLRFGQRRVSGETLFAQSLPVTAAACSAVEVPIEAPLCADADAYLFTEFAGSKSLAFVNGYRGVSFTSDLNVEIQPPMYDGKEYRSTVTVKAIAFAKAVFLDAAEALDLLPEDNYFDLEPGEVRSVSVRCRRPFRPEEIVVTTFADEWEE